MLGKRGGEICGRRGKLFVLGWGICLGGCVRRGDLGCERRGILCWVGRLG